MDKKFYAWILNRLCAVCGSTKHKVKKKNVRILASADICGRPFSLPTLSLSLSFAVTVTGTKILVRYRLN